jgi:hypothetical protein
MLEREPPYVYNSPNPDGGPALRRHRSPSPKPMRRPLASCLIPLLVLSGAAHAAQNPQWIEDAKKKLAAVDEGNVRGGAILCLQLNSPESAELLLKSLAGAQPHFRDIAFEYL